MVLSVITLNANGLHDLLKWKELWSYVPKVDVICLQETHLLSQQEHAFQLYAQGYDFYYSHGTSASCGVCTAVKRSKGLVVNNIGAVPGRLLNLEIECPQG